MRIPFTNIEVSPSKAISAAVSTFTSLVSSLFASAPSVAAVSNVVSNAIANVNAIRQAGTTTASNAVSSLFNTAATYTPAKAAAVEAAKATVEAVEPRRSSRLAALPKVKYN